MNQAPKQATIINAAINTGIDSITTSYTKLQCTGYKC